MSLANILWGVVVIIVAGSGQYPETHSQCDVARVRSPYGLFM